MKNKYIVDTSQEHQGCEGRAPKSVKRVSTLLTCKDKTTKHIPTRMCLVCRTKAHQSKLIRLQYKGNIVPFTGSGRSFYVCEHCILENTSKVKGRFRQFGDKNFINDFVENIRYEITK